MCPIIDVISDETFEYVAASDLTWGGRVKMLSYRVKKAVNQYHAQQLKPFIYNFYLPEKSISKSDTCIY